MSVPVRSEAAVVDTNILVSALTSAQGTSRQVLRKVLQRQVLAWVSLPLVLEYEDVLSRPDVMQRSPLTPAEQSELLDAFLSCTRLVEVYYRWRPNLRDEGDNHVVELAVAANAPILTWNIRDFAQSELRFAGLRVLTPAQWLKE